MATADADRDVGGGWSSFVSSPERGDPADYCSREGALALKAKIEAYWRERGLDVMIALHNVGFHPAIRAARYDVRSDMVNGMPRVHGAGKKAPTPANDDVNLDEFADDADLSFE